MKPKKLLMFLSLASLMLISCNQIENVVSSTMDASKTSNIKKGEPVIFKFNSIPDSSNVVWKVTPYEGVTLKADGSKASALFSQAGSYSINATYGNAVVKTNVLVIDSVYNPTVNSLTPLVSGETLNVTAIINDSSSVGKPDILLTLVFTTSNKYNCLNNFLLVKLAKTDPLSEIISFDGVFTPDSKFCSAGEKVAEGSVTCTFFITNSTTNSLEISLGGKSYKGYYYVSNKQLYIYWPYTTGIIFNNAVVINNGNNANGFDVDNPDVTLFVSQLKTGTYNSYVKDEYGQNLWLAMPKFTVTHIPALLEYAKDTASITKFPLNPLSSRLPYPYGRSYIILSEGLLWIVEGIRTHSTYPSLDPYLIDGSPLTADVKKGLTKKEILGVRELYYNWWNRSAIIPEWWLTTPPLSGTTYSWF